MRRNMIVFLIVLLWNSFCYAVDISGPVTGVWDSTNNPYNIIGDTYVPANLSLRINPGCFIIFQGYWKIGIEPNAILKAVGTFGDSIIFTTDTLVNINGWKGIRFDNANPACSLTYCRIEYGKQTGNIVPDNVGAGVSCYFSPITIAYCNISRNSASRGGGIYCIGEPGPLIQGNLISHNYASSSAYAGGGGIFVDRPDFSARIYNNTIYENGSASRGGGIECYGSHPVIRDRIIWGNLAPIGAQIDSVCRYAER